MLKKSCNGGIAVSVVGAAYMRPMKGDEKERVAYMSDIHTNKFLLSGFFNNPEKGGFADRWWRVRRRIEKHRSVISRSPQENMEPSCPISFDIQNFLFDHFRSGENHEVPTLISRHPSSRQIQDASPSPWRAQQGEILSIFSNRGFCGTGRECPASGSGATSSATRENREFTSFFAFAA